MTGRQIGHYRILAMLGAGGMGEVYRAHDERLDRDVALKLLPAATFEDAAARARLVREARAAGALNHASICTIHDVGEADGPRWTAENRQLVDRAKPAISPTAETTREFYFVPSSVRKSGCTLVRQLRGPHLSTWAWWSKRSSSAVIAAVSPSSLPQSSTGRLDVSSVDARS